VARLQLGSAGEESLQAVIDDIDSIERRSSSFPDARVRWHIQAVRVRAVASAMLKPDGSPSEKDDLRFLAMHLAPLPLVTVQERLLQLKEYEASKAAGQRALSWLPIWGMGQATQHDVLLNFARATANATLLADQADQIIAFEEADEQLTLAMRSFAWDINQLSSSANALEQIRLAREQNLQNRIERLRQSEDQEEQQLGDKLATDPMKVKPAEKVLARALRDLAGQPSEGVATSAILSVAAAIAAHPDVEFARSPQVFQLRWLASRRLIQREHLSLAVGVKWLDRHGVHPAWRVVIPRLHAVTRLVLTRFLHAMWLPR
jgi:hypothetical protein